MKLSEALMECIEKKKELDFSAPYKEEIDEEIKHYIEEINKLGFETVTSCAGHEDSIWDTPYVEIWFKDRAVRDAFAVSFITLTNLMIKFSKGVAKLTAIALYKGEIVSAYAIPDGNLELTRRFLFGTVTMLLKHIKYVRSNVSFIYSNGKSETFLGEDVAEGSDK